MIWLTTWEGVRFDLAKAAKYYSFQGVVYVDFPVTESENITPDIAFAGGLDPAECEECLAWLDGQFSPADCVWPFPEQFRKGGVNHGE